MDNRTLNSLQLAKNNQVFRNPKQTCLSLQYKVDIFLPVHIFYCLYKHLTMVGKRDTKILNIFPTGIKN